MIRTMSSGAAGPAPPGVEVWCARYERDEVLFDEGQAAERIYQLVSGALMTFRRLRDGRRQIEALHFAGDAFGLESEPMHRVGAQALSTITVRAMPRLTPEMLGARPFEVTRRLLDLTTQCLSRSQHHAMTLARRSARERMAALLLEIDERTGGEALLDMPMTRQDIADYLSLTMETVSRVLTVFQRRGIIALPAARQLRLLDRAQLEAMLQ